MTPGISARTVRPAVNDRADGQANADGFSRATILLVAEDKNDDSRVTASTTFYEKTIG